MVRPPLLAALLLAALPLAAQEATTFTITRDADTVASEAFAHAPAELTGSLTRVSGTVRERVRYRATVVDDQSAPLLELTAWRADDPEESPARQTVRVIFKDDSVAVDDVNRWGGVMTRVLPTRPAAVPYLNLSIGFLELATRRLAASRVDSLPVPFFNLGGGQTVVGGVRRLGADSAAVRLGAVEFRVAVDAAGRILGGRVPSQGLLIARGTAR
ncbi:MAG: hypothetical protein KA180_02125 [Gemmatimonadales bacterium]|jgi:hypothetical protein|nr:hypothetical protein [Gemmatimonadota bacterium]MBK7784591.1 hypothetical protein [Gemmatimonadota bacterium]MBP6668216.1 hypothetical protein [Gemmatimonadales bacterium]MBP9199057.1 hypothetical protein [Gemmatimonadales bacterium]